MKHVLVSVIASAGLLFAAAASAQQTHTLTFDNGPQGWDGNAWLEDSGGNPGANAHFYLEAWGMNYFSLPTDAAFTGDLTRNSSIAIGLDVLVNSILYDGEEVSRNMIVEFRSRALAQDGYPYTSVWFNLGSVQAGPDWRTLSVTVDPRSSSLPAGWGGYGAEDPVTFVPMLPAGVTFAQVMASVDETVFSTFEPGYVYWPTIFDAHIDNLRIDRAPLSEQIFADDFE